MHPYSIDSEDTIDKHFLRASKLKYHLVVNIAMPKLSYVLDGKINTLQNCNELLKIRYPPIMRLESSLFESVFFDNKQNVHASLLLFFNIQNYYVSFQNFWILWQVDRWNKLGLSIKKFIKIFIILQKNLAMLPWG